MSFPMFVLSFREIPKAKLMSEVLFTIPDTSQGPKYIGKHNFVLILYKLWMNFGKSLVKICLIGRPKLGSPIRRARGKSPEIGLGGG